MKTMRPAVSSNHHNLTSSIGEPESQAPALQRGLAILEMLSAKHEGATLSEISSDLNLSTASVFRLTGVLEEAGYVHKDSASRRFQLTRKLMLLSLPSHQGRGLVESCLPAMREVLQQTGETVQMCTLAGNECVIIEQLASTFPFKYLVDLGSRPPLHSCAPGKAMMAYLQETDLSKMLGEIKLIAHTERTITSKRAMLEEISVIRKQGFAVDRAEHFDGIHCVAAPVLDRLGHPVAAITIAGPSSRITAKRFNELGAIMKKAAQDAAQLYLG